MLTFLGGCTYDHNSSPSKLLVVPGLCGSEESNYIRFTSINLKEIEDNVILEFHYTTNMEMVDLDIDQLENEYKAPFSLTNELAVFKLSREIARDFFDETNKKEITFDIKTDEWNSVPNADGLIVYFEDIAIDFNLDTF
jgi:hypothetical protein